MRYGLELPQYHTSIWDCQDTIKKVDAFLKNNGATDVFGMTHTVGAIDVDGDENKDSPCGIIFHGSAKLAQAVADAFPQYRVMDSRGKVIAPAKAATPAPAPQTITQKTAPLRRPPGPKR